MTSLTKEQLIDKVAAIAWGRDYPKGGSRYLTFEETPYHDQELYVKEVTPIVEMFMEREAKLQEQITHLESLRPLWAKGYTSDSVAAQILHSSLCSIWQILGANNQTECVAKLKELVQLRDDVEETQYRKSLGKGF